jgi:polysaccharide export outer membrane protein
MYSKRLFVPLAFMLGGFSLFTEIPLVRAQQDNPGYTVQAGDVLEVSVWREPDLTREVLVRPDGGMSFPLVGDLIGTNKTVTDIQQEIAERLTTYIPEPVVTVSVKEIKGNSIYVIGQVNAPGEYVATRRMDVMQALSLAGGMTAYASGNKIKILRRDNSSKQVSIAFRYDDVAKGQNLEQNILLQGGDVVVVP